MINLIFGIFVFGWIIYVFFIIYHFIRFGIGRQPKILAFWLLIGSFLILGLIFISFKSVDWSGLIQYVSNIFIFQ